MQLAASCHFWKLPAAPVAAPGWRPHHLSGAWVSGPPDAAPCGWPGPEACGGESRSLRRVLVMLASDSGVSQLFSVAVVSHGGLGTE